VARPSLDALAAPALSRASLTRVSLLRAVALACALAAGALAAAGCSEACCTVDSEPIPVARAPLGMLPGRGGLLARAQPPGGGTAFDMVVDTASPVTILAGPPSQGSLHVQQGGFDLLDASEPMDVRARFRNLGLFSLPLGTVGDDVTTPRGVMGGDLLHAYSVEMRFAQKCPGADAGADDASAADADADADADAGDGGGAPPAQTCSSVTFWNHQGASLSFLEDAGYAVLRFALFGGGETTASSQGDFLGLEGPVTLPATRIVLRACAQPEPFDPLTATRQTCCTRGDEIGNATGVDLALLVATGVGPLVLSQSAWLRIAARITPAPAVTTGRLYVATWPMMIPAQWTTLPRFALVDNEPPSTGDEGPCVDLSRARRIEWTARQTALMDPFSEHPDVAECVQPCDTDPSQPNEALSSAAYLEIGGDVPVAVVDDAEPFLQSLRFDIRPEGPDIDGLVGAAALGAARLELDYLSDTPRAIFSCEPNTPREACYAAARCPRLPDLGHDHLCFGLRAHGLPKMCAPSGCGM
jgi:hypothetical protein